MTHAIPIAAITADHALALYQTARQWGGDEGAHALYVMALATITGQSPEDAAPDAAAVHDYFTLQPNGQWHVGLMTEIERLGLAAWQDRIERKEA